MIALAACIRNHWHAVERDLLAMGKSADDIGTKLSTCELISIVLAAPTGTAVRESDPTRWSRTEELMANLGEQQAGLVSLGARYPRPQVDSTPQKPYDSMAQLAPYKGIQLESADSPSEFMKKLRERQQRLRDAHQGEEDT